MATTRPAAIATAATTDATALLMDVADLATQIAKRKGESMAEVAEEVV